MGVIKESSGDNHKGVIQESSRSHTRTFECHMLSPVGRKGRPTDAIGAMLAACEKAEVASIEPCSFERATHGTFTYTSYPYLKRG